MDGQKNIVTYEFQGNLLPLEKAFAQVGKLFKRYIREAKAASEDGKLNPDMGYAAKELQHYYKRLKPLAEKAKLGLPFTKRQRKEANTVYKNLIVKTKRFKEARDKLLNKKSREERREEKKEAKVKDYTSISSQFKAQTQADQLSTLMYSLPNLDPKVQADINSYVEAWKKARIEFDGSEESAKALAKATEELDDKAREYIPTLKVMVQNQKRATNSMEQLFSRVIYTVSSFEFWFRTIKEGIGYLSDYIESINFIDVSLKNIKWEDYINNVEKATEATKKFKDALEEARWSLGLDATDLNTTAATFIAFANASSVAAKDVTIFSQNLAQASIDMASLYNKDVTVMLTAMRSALAGNTRAMMQYGISVHDASINEWLLEKGINKQMNTMSETSQVLARYVYLIEKTTSAHGDMARTLKSPANQIRVLRNQLKLLTQNLGAIFNTVIYPAIRILNEILIPLNAFLSALTSLATADYSSSIRNVTDDVDDMTDALEDASNAAVGLTSLDEINTDTPKAGSTKTGIDAEIQALVDELKVYDGFIGKTSKLTEAMKELGEALAPIWAVFANTKVLDAFAWALNVIGLTLKPISLWFEGMKEKFEGLPEWLQNVIKFIGSAIGVLSGLAAALVVVSVGMALFKTLAASTAWKNFVISLKAMFVSIMNVAKALITATLNLLKFIAQLIIAGVKAVATAIKNLILSKSFWAVALGVIAAAGIAAAAVAAIVGTAVAIGYAVQKSHEPNLSTPALATGGVATGPTFAMIGEGKYNEAVVPLGNSPQFTSMKESIAERVVEKQGKNNVSDLPQQSVVLSIDGRALGRAQFNNMSKVRRQVGVDIK